MVCNDRMPETVPARIIRTAKRRALTLKRQAMVTNPGLLNPDFEYFFFDDEDVERFIEWEYPQSRFAFRAFPFPIQRYDFFRYLAVYRLGGFYVDLNVLLASVVAGLRPTGCVFSFDGLTLSRLLRSNGMDWGIGNYAFGAALEHPFLRAVIENCVKAQTDDPRWAEEMMRGAPLLSRAEHVVLNSTGPGQLSRTLAENPDLAATVTVLFPGDVCDMSTRSVSRGLGVHPVNHAWRLFSRIARRQFAGNLGSWARGGLLRQTYGFGHTRNLQSQWAHQGTWSLRAATLLPDHFKACRCRRGGGIACRRVERSIRHKSATLPAQLRGDLIDMARSVG